MKSTSNRWGLQPQVIIKQSSPRSVSWTGLGYYIPYILVGVSNFYILWVCVTLDIKAFINIPGGIVMLSIKPFKLVSKSRDVFLHLCSPELLVPADSVVETSGLKFREPRRVCEISFVFGFPSFSISLHVLLWLLAGRDGEEVASCSQSSHRATKSFFFYFLPEW